MSAPGAVGQAAGGLQLQVRPIGRGLQPVQQPAAQRPLLLGLPGLLIPAALVLGALDEADVAVPLDQGDAPLHQPPVVLGPVGGDLGDGLGAVALEPGGLQLTRGHLAGHEDLEGALAEIDLGHLSGIERSARPP